MGPELRLDALLSQHGYGQRVDEGERVVVTAGQIRTVR